MITNITFTSTQNRKYSKKELKNLSSLIAADAKYFDNLSKIVARLNRLNDIATESDTLDVTVEDVIKIIDAYMPDMNRDITKKTKAYSIVWVPCLYIHVEAKQK